MASPARVAAGRLNGIKSGIARATWASGSTVRPSVAARRAAGICVQAGCGQPVTHGHWRCRRCRAHEAEEQAMRREDAALKRAKRTRKEAA